MKSIKFANLTFKGLNRKSLLTEDSENLKIITTVNAEFIVRANEDEKFRKIIDNSYATFDGQVPYLLAKMKIRDVAFEKISGSDFAYDICEYAKKNDKKVFFLGGKEKSNNRAVNTIKKRYDIDVAGYSPMYKPFPFPAKHDQDIIDKIRDFKPHFLLVGFGALKQEYWIDQHKEELKKIGVKIAIGTGGTFEFICEDIKRAPKIYQKLGLEGVFRFFQEPNLLRIKRLLISLKIFLYINK